MTDDDKFTPSMLDDVRGVERNDYRREVRVTLVDGTILTLSGRHWHSMFVGEGIRP